MPRSLVNTHPGHHDQEWLECTLDLLDLDVDHAARLLELDPDELTAMLTGRATIPAELADVLDAVCLFTETVIDRMCRSTQVVIFPGDSDFVRANPAYADYSAAWHRMAALRAAVRNPDLEVTLAVSPAAAIA